MIISQSFNSTDDNPIKSIFEVPGWVLERKKRLYYTVSARILTPLPCVFYGWSGIFGGMVSSTVKTSSCAVLLSC